jgi:hypothetical protein
MASLINPTNIDVTYPIAGQDNDTQGFRDNFTNIKNNFITAKTEIDAIQGNVSTLQGTFVSTPPTTITSPGEPGQIAFDADNIYICIAADTWRAAALNTF